MTAASCVLSIIYKLYSAIGLPCTACKFVQLNRPTTRWRTGSQCRSRVLCQLKALKLAVGDATETTVAAVKSAAFSESDCDTVNIMHLVEHAWMWADSQTAVNYFDAQAQLSHH